MIHTQQGFALTEFQVMEPDCVRDNNWFYNFWRKHGVAVDESFAIDTRTGIQSRPHFCARRSFADVAVEMIQRLQHSVTNDYHGDCDGFLLISSRPGVEAFTYEIAERTRLPGESVNWACSGFAGGIGKLMREARREYDEAGPEHFAHTHRVVIWLEMWRDMVNLCNFRVAPLFGDCCVGTTFTGFLNKKQTPAPRFAIRDAFARRIGVDKPAIWVNRCVDGIEYCRDIQTGKQRTRPVIDADDRPYTGIAVDMDGRMVFREAPRRMIDMAEMGLRRCGLRFEDAVDLLPHSANERMRPPMAELLNTRGHRRHCTEGEGPAWQECDIHMDMKMQGNPGSGAIPLKLERRQHLYQPGDIIVTPAVGAGRGIGNWEIPIADNEIVRTPHQFGELTEGNAVLQVL